MFTKVTPSQTQNAQFERLLRGLGAVSYDLWLPETQILPTMINQGEQITGLAYGRYKQANNTQIGRGVLVATNQRVLLIDKKPTYIKCDEITYGVISGVTYSRAGIAGTVTLHTRVGDINIRTFNQKCARQFIKAVETNIFQGDGQYVRPLSPNG